MPYRRFLTFNAAGGVAWGTAATVAGYLAGASYQRIAHAFGTVGAVVVVVVVAGALVALLLHRRRSRTDHAVAVGRPL
jgi:membrane protein DedA with SNARE-associated domain